MRYRPCLILATCFISLRSLARAEDSVDYTDEEYREGDGRVVVQTQSAAVTEDLGTEMLAKLTGTNDAIAGATPTGVPASGAREEVPMTDLEDHRKAWSANLSRQFASINLDAGFAYSREHDYTSHAYSINTITDFNQKNTELTLGAAANQDNVHVLIEGPAWRNKRGENGIVGLTQIIDSATTVSLNLTWGRSTGFNSDQYKIVQKSIQIFPGIFLPKIFAENRPDVRDTGAALLALNHAWDQWNAAIDLSYRYFADTSGIGAHTVEFSWLQRLAPTVILQPNLRYYQQQAAKFYYYNLDQTDIIPVAVPTGTGAAYSSDYRLSEMRTYTYGLKVIWTVRSWAQLTLAFDKYDMQGLDGITPQSAYARAKITTAGIKFTR